jgi:hypothetical protein
VCPPVRLSRTPPRAVGFLPGSKDNMGLAGNPRLCNRKEHGRESVAGDRVAAIPPCCHLEPGRTVTLLRWAGVFPTLKKGGPWAQPAAANQRAMRGPFQYATSPQVLGE